jgi:hypothetical protein
MVTQLRFLLPFLGLTLLATAPLQAQFQDPDCNDCNCAIGNGPLTASTLVSNLANHDLTWPSFGSSFTWSNANIFNQRFHRFYLVAGNRYTFSLCGANTANTVMYIAQATGAPLNCDNDGCGAPNGPSILTFVPQISALHRLFVYDGSCGNWFVNPSPSMSVTVTMEAPNPLPVNDEPCGAIALPMTGPNCVFTNTNSTAATLSVISGTGTAPSCASPSLMQNDVWFSTTVPPSGLIGISTSESGSLCAGAFNLYTATACNGTFTQLSNSCALGGTTGPNTDPALVYDAVAAGLNVGDVVYIRYWERNGNENGTFQICAYEAQRPPNDEPCGAITLPVNVGCTFSNYSNANATPVSTVTTSPDPVTAGCGGPAGNDMWFAVTVTADMVTNGFTVNTTAGTLSDMAMTWYRLTSGSACGPGTMQQIACNNNQAAINQMPRINSGPAGLVLVVGETIYIRIWANSPWEGTFGICATVNQPPPNNMPCGAIPLTAQYGCVMSNYSNENAFNTPSSFPGGTVAAPTCQTNWNNDVWFTVVMPPNGVIQLDTQVGSLVNGGMALYSATGSCGTGNLNLTQLACANVGSQQGPASSNMPYINYSNAGLAGQTLYVRVWRQGNQTNGNPDGNFGLCARRTDTPPGNCFYTLTLSDSAGDGWDGSFVTVCINGSCTNYTVNGATASVNIGVTIGQTITLSYTAAGGFQNQNSYSLTLFGQPKYISGTSPAQGLVWAETVTCDPPPAPQSDCIGAFTLCSQNILVNQAPTNTGGVADLNTSNRGCFNNNERQGLWYVWTVQESGNLAFTVYPQPWPVPPGTPFTIFDWAIWGPYAGLTCPPPGPPIRCNWASVFAPKGMQYDNSLPTSVGGAGPAMIRHLPVLAGEVYTLYVDNWGMTGLNFSIEWNTTTNPAYQPMASVDCIILPVDMIGFDVQALARTVEVSWRTVSEHNSAYFDVERSADGVNFLTIGRVAAAGNSDNLIDYSFVDDAPLEGVSYYRLRRVDQNDRADHTDAKQVMFRRGVASIELFPNPATNEIQVLYELPEEGIVQWRILDTSGRFILEGNDAGDRGRNRMEIPVVRLDQGSYILELRDGRGHPQGVARFVKH